jgi:hypothetical protein
MTSPDGITWISRTGISGTWNSVAWNGSVFAAVGPGATTENDGIVMTSPDGIHWTQRTNIPAGTWQDIAWNGSIFASVSGNTGSIDLIMTNFPDAVTSVAKRVGAVVLNTNDVTENLAGPYYHTTARVRGNVGNAAPINYDSSTGRFSHANSGVVVGTYGNSSIVPSITVDVSGHVISATNTTIAIAASQITSGTLAVVRGGTGQSTYTNGQILIGNTGSTGLDKATIAQSAPVIVTVSQGGITLSHARSGVTAGVYGNATIIPVITVDANGHLTAVTNTAVSTLPAATANGQLLIGNTVSGGFNISTIAQTAPIIVTLGQGTIRLSHAASGVTAGVYGNATIIPVITVDANGHLTAVANTAVSTLPAATANGQLLIGNTVSGGFDVSTIAQTAPIIVTLGQGTIRLSHAASGVTAGVYGNATLIPAITVDANGHVTAVTNTAVSTLPTATANGQLLIGNTVSGGFDVNTLTAGNNIIIANGQGTITISVPALMPTGNGVTGDRVFYENDQNVAGNYTITTGKSAMSAGPITINPSIIVTLPPGSRWVVV